MNRNDVIDVLTAVAAATRRTIGEADVDIWEGVIGDQPRYSADGKIDIALRAVRNHLREQPGVWLEPGHVHQRIRAHVREELEHEPEEARTAREEAIAARIADRVDALAERKALPEAELKYKRRQNTVLTVPCPWCKARANSRCMIPGTDLPFSDFHPSRYDAARMAS